MERCNSGFLQSPHCTANCLQGVRFNGQGTIICKSCATHQVLTTCSMSCATWYEVTAIIHWFHYFRAQDHMNIGGWHFHHMIFCGSFGILSLVLQLNQKVWRLLTELVSGEKRGVGGVSCTKLSACDKKKYVCVPYKSPLSKLSSSYACTWNRIWQSLELEPRNIQNHLWNWKNIPKVNKSKILPCINICFTCWCYPFYVQLIYIMWKHCNYCKS